LIVEYANTAYRKCEILRTDDDIFDVWTDFVVAGEAITDFVPIQNTPIDSVTQLNSMMVKHRLNEGVRLIAFITRARTPMPQSTDLYFSECEVYKSYLT